MSQGGFANPIFVALDTPFPDQAIALAEQVRSYVGGLKVGLEFISANGPEGVKRIVALGLPVFADVKFHDIPNTVAGAAREIAKLGVRMFNVHASGGEAMMRAAADAAKGIDPDIKLIAVTVLTSFTSDDLPPIGLRDDASLQVHRLALLAKSSGLDGVVCSPVEARMVRVECPKPFLIVTPGVRPKGGDRADQRRVMSPAEAMKAGADIMVVGRPITGAPNPAEAARAISQELAALTGQDART